MADVTCCEQVHQQHAEDAIYKCVDEDNCNRDYIPPNWKHDREEMLNSEDKKKKRKKKGKKGLKAKETVMKEGLLEERMKELMASISHIFKKPVNKISTIVVQRTPVHSYCL